MTGFTKTILLGNGPLCGKRVTIPAGDTQATLPVNAADMFGAWAVYRPSSERSSDGSEIWTEHVESQWVTVVRRTCSPLWPQWGAQELNV
jgi:hypothetical protein